jgi:hypothetical protein
VRVTIACAVGCREFPPFGRMAGNPPYRIISGLHRHPGVVSSTTNREPSSALTEMSGKSNDHDGQQFQR